MPVSERENSLPMPFLLHDHLQFRDLLGFVAEKQKISLVLVEKD